MYRGAFLVRGLEKVRAEFSLTALAYNLRRVLDVFGEIPSSLSTMASHDLPLLGQPWLPTSSCFFVRLTTRRFFVPA
jgi:hypothetical protein